MTRPSKRPPGAGERRTKQQTISNRVIWGTIGLAVVVVASLIWLGNRPTGPVTVIKKATPPAYADGAALGPADAPVLIEVYSDFQ